MADQILKDYEISNIERILEEFKKYVEGYCKELDVLIATFSQEGIVQELFESGDFGKEQQDYIRTIRNSLHKYEMVVCDGPDSLYVQTKAALDAQRQLLASGTTNGAKSFIKPGAVARNYGSERLEVQ